MQLAQVLDKLMTKNDISAYKISKDTVISDRLIGYWRKGEKLPGAENLLIIANYFGISVDYLLTGEEKNTQANQLSENEQELLSNFQKLSDVSKGRLLEKAENLVELESLTKNENSKIGYSFPRFVYKKEWDIDEIISTVKTKDEYSK